MQVQGSIAGMSTQVVLNHVADWKYKITDVADPALVRSNTESNATSIEARMMVIPTFGVSVGYMDFSNKLNSALDYKTMSAGLIYNYSENVRLSLERSNINNKTAADVAETTAQVLFGF